MGFWVFVGGVCSASPCSASTLTVGQMGNYGYGSMTMEKNFRVSVIIMIAEEFGGCASLAILW